MTKIVPGLLSVIPLGLFSHEKSVETFDLLKDSKIVAEGYPLLLYDKSHCFL